MPQLDVLLFASYADAFGAPSLTVEMPPDATVADLVTALRSRPGGSVLPERPLVAVDRAYAAPGDRVVDRGEVALIPPVAGG
ncbi:MAG: MoaD/ThiS family protein [Gemmatimonadaceae bacterium]|jgi:molybdopterin converting factor small subunit|nr:MoaD/ThiS family protein [Gemmatimonadaceae bacterium]